VLGIGNLRDRLRRQFRSWAGGSQTASRWRMVRRWC